MKRIAIVGHGSQAVVEALKHRLTEEEFEIIAMPDIEIPKANVFLNEPIPITRLRPMEHLPKVNCKKGHNYKMVEEKKEGLLIKQRWKCRCGKELV